MTRWHRAYRDTVADAKLGEVALAAPCSRAIAIPESCAAVNGGGMTTTDSAPLAGAADATPN